MASILEGMPKSPAEMTAVLERAGPMIETFLKRAKPNRKAREVAALLGKGLSLADILDITPKERDAVLTMGFRSIQLGDYPAARDLLAGLVRIEPMDKRAVYALGVAQMGCREHEIAGKTFIHFIALDATNPEGYLRLGECLQANGERDAARGCFEAAKIQVGEGYGTPDMIAHADRMIATLGETAGVA